jgi:hypothetical protein
VTVAVTVETYQQRAKVQRVNSETGAPILAPEILEPGSKYSFYLHNQVALAMQEIPDDD